MRDTIHFFKNLTILIVIIGLIVQFLPSIFSFLISDKNHFIASTIDKENRLKSIKSPKLVIIGGSGSAFSVDSEALEDSLKIPTVNMAIAYGLGLGFMLNEVKPEIKQGDKIVIIGEYYLPLQGNFKLLALLNDLNPNAYKYFKFDIKDWIKFKNINFQRVASSMFYKIKNMNDNEKTALRSSYNKNGDMIAHLEEPNKRPLNDTEDLIKTTYSDELNALNDFVTIAKKNGATVSFCFPAYPKSEYETNKVAIKKFEKLIRENFTGNVLGNPEQNLYNDEDFYDTIYHLNKTGRAKRLVYLQHLLEPTVQ